MGHQRGPRVNADPGMWQLIASFNRVFKEHRRRTAHPWLKHLLDRQYPEGPIGTMSHGHNLSHMSR